MALQYKFNVFTGNFDLVDVATGSTFYSETPTGAIDGVNKVYTTSNTITTVFALAVNGMFIHPSEYVVSGAGFTMNTAIPSDLSGTGFTISYV